MQIKALRGTSDLFSPAIERWRSLEATTRSLFNVYGFKEIRTPLLEETLLFQRAVGETTDVVEKQMYTFLDRGERSLSLRPEGTASVVRAYLEHHFDQQPGLARLFYIGPMFRAERPQAGRFRQFHQIGAEVLGSYDPRVDAEVLSFIGHLLEQLGLSGYTLHLNSLGSAEDKKNIGHFLREALKKDLSSLCEECQKRFERNVYRILDCKVKSCQSVVQKLPPFIEKLSPDSKAHFARLQELLSMLKVPYALSSHLVRGLDYYTHTAFEITHPHLGAQDAVCAGGRYDNLVETLGGKATGAFGFSIGIERLLLALETQQVSLDSEDSLDAFIVTIGEDAQSVAFSLLETLRKQGISALLDFEGKSLKAQMRLADHLKAHWVVVIGEEELKTKKYSVKAMETGKEEKLGEDALIKALQGEPKGVCS